MSERPWHQIKDLTQAKQLDQLLKWLAEMEREINIPLLNTRTVTSAYTLDSADETILANASGGAFTITLFTAVGIAGKQLRIKKIDTTTNIVTIDGDGTETIEGDTTYPLGAQNRSVILESDDANWRIMGIV